jgi:hypothetical protein
MSPQMAFPPLGSMLERDSQVRLTRRTCWKARVPQAALSSSGAMALAGEGLGFRQGAGFGGLDGGRVWRFRWAIRNTKRHVWSNLILSSSGTRSSEFRLLRGPRPRFRATGQLPYRRDCPSLQKHSRCDVFLVLLHRKEDGYLIYCLLTCVSVGEGVTACEGGAGHAFTPLGLTLARGYRSSAPGSAKRTKRLLRRDQ